MSLLKCVFLRIFFLYFFSVPVTNAGGEQSKGQTSRLTEDEDEQLVLVHEPLLGDLDRNRGSAIDGRIKPFVIEFNTNYLLLQRAVLQASWNYETTGEEKYEKELDNAMKMYEDFILKEWRKFHELDPKSSIILDGKLKNQVKRINYLIRTNIPTSLRTKINLILKQADIIYHDSAQDAAQELLKNSDAETNAWKYVDKNIGRRIKPLFGQYFEAMKEVAKYNGFSTVAQFLMYKERFHDSFTPASLLSVITMQCSSFRTRLWNYLYTRHTKNLTNRNTDAIILLVGIEIYELDRLNAENEALTPVNGEPDEIKQAIQNKSSTLDWLELANIYYHKSLDFEILNTSEIRSKLIEPRNTTTPTIRKNFFVWNYFNGDYRIMWKPSEPEEDMSNMFKAVGYVHNFEIFRHLEPIHQSWTNEVFGEAIVGAVSLSAFSPSGLKRLGVLSSSNILESIIINRQLKNVLHIYKIIHIGMVTDCNTQSMYDDKCNITDYQSEWRPGLLWKSDTHPPILGGHYFAPGTVKNLLDGTKYIKETITHVLKYQFFQHLCVVAGKFDPRYSNERPLYRCDLHENVDAIKLIKFAMRQGNALSWKAMMELMTGSKELDARPMLNYYRPLGAWFDKNVNVSSLENMIDKFTEKLPRFYRS